MVVMPPAAMTSRVVAARTAWIAGMSVPCIRPSLVDVGVEEVAEERLELADGLDGGERQRACASRR